MSARQDPARRPVSVPNEAEVAAEFPAGEDRPLREQTSLVDETGEDIRRYTGEPVETEYGVVIPQQMNVGADRVVGQGEFPAADPRDPDPKEVERTDPDAPGRSVFVEDEDAVEPNEPA